MFSGFMVNTWEVGTMVAVVGGVVGFFVVLRGSAFPAHAIPNGAFAGAAGANLIAVSPLIGLGVFSFGAALGIGALSRRGRSDAVTALALVMMLALGAAFLSLSTQYEPQIFSLLFGVSTSEMLPVIALGAVCVLAVAVLFRPLLLSSIAPDLAAARGLRPQRLEIAFLVVIACATTMTVPVVGALLIFTLMIGPSAAAQCFTNRVGRALTGSVAIALLTIWMALACAYESNWPVGFYVSVFSAVWYGIGRGYAAWERRRTTRATIVDLHSGATAH